jgi:ATP phosphoribosyltransferase
MESLTIAIPKGRLAGEFISTLSAAGIDAQALQTEGRSLLKGDGDVRFLLLRNEDVPTYVERGAAVMGVVGKDVLREQSGRDVIEYADLGFGGCSMVFAVPRGKEFAPGAFIRIATKYPNITREAMANTGYRYEIIALRGGCEIAPAAGLADAIVDLVASGETLRANNLEPTRVIERYTARLILNPAAYRMDSRVRELASRIVSGTENGGYV